jgi:polyisoprenoid-binding protein YceI
MSQILTVGPSHGDLLLRTGVEGKAARLGHRLTLVVRDWEATVLLDGEVPTSVALTAALASLEVVKGEGGAKPLSDRDKRSILEGAAKTLGTDKHPALDLVSTAIDPGYVVHGDVTLHGATGPVQLAVAVVQEGTSWRITGTTALRQSEFGIKAFSQMLGALQVSDEVAVSLEVLVPKP